MAWASLPLTSLDIILATRDTNMVFSTAVKQVLDGTISEKGVLAPMNPKINNPLMKELKENYGLVSLARLIDTHSLTVSQDRMCREDPPVVRRSAQSRLQTRRSVSPYQGFCDYLQHDHHQSTESMSSQPLQKVKSLIRRQTKTR